MYVYMQDTEACTYVMYACIYVCTSYAHMYERMYVCMYVCMYVYQELDMSGNLLGKDENLSSVQEDVVTGGESIAGLLRQETCPIR